MGIMGSILNRNKKIDQKSLDKAAAKAGSRALNASIRVIRDNPACTYDTETGRMEWAKLSITPGDYIRIKHRYSDGYSQIEADEAGMFLGVEGDFLVFQTGVKKQKARLLETHSVEVMSRMEENTEE